MISNFRFVPGGHGTFLGLINAFVHIVMYTYYLLAGMGPKYQKYLWSAFIYYFLKKAPLSFGM
jgi:hypothetical protein